MQTEGEKYYRSKKLLNFGLKIETWNFRICITHKQHCYEATYCMLNNDKAPV